MIKLALFGAGRIGHIHGHNVAAHPQAELVALHDPYQANADSLSAALGCKSMTAAEIFADPAIDGILVCSATDTHADLIEQAVAAGKHVFCEKPIDLSLARVQQVLAKINSSDITSMVAFNRRFDPDFARLQQSIAAGDIGRVEMVSIISKDPSPPPIDYIKVSGGLFRDMTIHDFDMARFLLGEEVAQVTAQASCQVDPAIGAAGDVDTALVTLRTATGKLAQISNSRRASFGYDQRFEVHGSQGMLTAGNINEHSITSYTDQGVNAAKPMHFFLERYKQAYKAELDAFIGALKGTEVTLPSMYDGLQALRLAEAAILSVAQGKTIQLNTIGD
ncbi:MAG: inositol 2-dehydrogenase [Gammaproteobacteria bacterium]|jgi:myo-inositol 2-dehydrogenase/D-chiro-inositol 1-dehydrogenase|nr:inositol 2-dehydrogenase [Gammaproteobacteria bacterium]